jgi:transposase InsO family protein
VLSDNGREFCGRPDRNPYELFLQLEGIAHRGVVERLHRTLLDEHFRVEGRRTWFETVEEMQVALDAYLVKYNTDRLHQGRGMNGRTPWRAFLDLILANDNSTEDTDRQTHQATAD